MAKKPAEHVQFKLRVQQSLLQKLRKEAVKKGHSANNEAVERLEQSLGKDTKAMRDGAVIDMLVRHKGVSANILRDIADEVAKHPDWNHDEPARKDLVGWLYIAAHGKEPIEEPQPGDDE